MEFGKLKILLVVLTFVVCIGSSAQPGPKAGLTQGVSAENVEQPVAMRWIPGGSFVMGALESDRLSKAVEMPAHTVNIDGFWMDESEVTNLQFGEFVKATGYSTVPRI